MKPEWKTATWYATDPVGIKCVCGSNSGHPITNEWWDKHTSVWHNIYYAFKNWFRKEREND